MAEAEVKLWKAIKRKKVKGLKLGNTIKHTAREFLIDLFEGGVNAFIAFDNHPMHRVSAKKYATLANENFDLRGHLYYLKKNGLIKKVLEGKKKYIELTEKGFKTVAWSKIGQVEKPTHWDKCFRIVMFDIPNDKTSTRNIIRHKLKEIGFVSIQKSIYVYPFECKREIDAICHYCFAKKYLKYMVADIIEGEEDIIEKFLENGVLILDDLK